MTLRSISSLFFLLAVVSGARLPGDGDAPPVPRPSAHAPSAVVARVSRDAAGRAAPLPVGSLPFFYDLYTFRGHEGSTRVVAAFAVPVSRLKREWEDGGVIYRFDVTMVLSDTAAHSVSRTDDSVFVAVPRPLAGKHMLFTHVEVDAEPSRSTLQRVIMTDASTPGVGQLYSAPFPIPDYSGPDLMVSDIAMGQPGAQEGWNRAGNVLALFPTSQFPGSDFDLYYEIYNLPAGTPYTTEVSIEPSEDAGEDRAGSGNPVVIRFTGESSAGPDDSLNELRLVDASLEDGRYELIVTVTDETTGAVARRSRFFEVRAWGRGATLVPALPAKRAGYSRG